VDALLDHEIRYQLLRLNLKVTYPSIISNLVRILVGAQWWLGSFGSAFIACEIYPDKIYHLNRIFFLHGDSATSISKSSNCLRSVSPFTLSNPFFTAASTNNFKSVGDAGLTSSQPLRMKDFSMNWHYF
jgi:hypothetical protein